MTFNPFASATDMLRAMQKKEISSVELLESHLRRIELHNPTLNSIVTLDVEAALRAAKQADDALARGDHRELTGLPLTIKDCIDVHGLIGTGGIEQFAHRVPDDDSRLAARVRAAGGVIMGKTNVPPNAADWQSDNPIFGRTNNPWNLGCSPGGSTGGGAAALAAGLTPLEFGSDIGGSIRIPAAFCGVFGHKPSETAIPRSGHFPGSPHPNAAAVMCVQGPLARTVGDLELAFDVVSGPDVGEDAAWNLAVPPPRHDHLAAFRVAILPTIPWLPVDDEITATVENLAAELSRAGAQIKIIQPDGFGDLRRHHELYCCLLSVWSSINSSESRKQHLAENMRKSDEFGEFYARGLLASASEYLVWHAEREDLRRSFREFFSEWDVMLAPNNIVPPFPHTKAPWPDRWLNVNGHQVQYGLQNVYPAVATLSGQPATAFPVSLNDSGLPVGLQAIGPYLEDRTTIRFAALIESEFGGFHPPPGY